MYSRYSKILGIVLLTTVLIVYSPISTSCSCERSEIWEFLTPEGSMPRNAAGVLWWGRFDPVSKQPWYKITASNSSNETVPIEYKYWHSYLINYDDMRYLKGDFGSNQISALDWTTGKNDSEWYSEDEDWHTKNKFLKKIDGKWIVQRELHDRLSRSNLWLFRPKGGFEKGETYTFSATNIQPFGEKKSKSVTVSLSDTSLHPIDYKVPIKVSAASKKIVTPAAGMCSEEYLAFTNSVSMSLPDEFARFKEFLFFETIVDLTESKSGDIWRPSDGMCDVPVPGQSKLGKGKDLIYDAKSVQMRAFLPGTEVWIETPVVDLTKPPVPGNPDIGLIDTIQ